MNHLVMRAHSRMVVEQMARHYGAHGGVVD